MTTLQMVLGIVLVVLAAATIIVVLMQKGREANASAVQGTTDSDFFDKTAGHQKDDTLANITKVLGTLLFIAALATIVVILFV